MSDAERAVRKNSLWRRRSDGWTVRVLAARKDPGGRHGLPTRWVIFVDVEDAGRGGVMHEADFRLDFDWVCGH